MKDLSDRSQADDVAAVVASGLDGVEELMVRDVFVLHGGIADGYLHFADAGNALQSLLHVRYAIRPGHASDFKSRGCHNDLFFARAVPWELQRQGRTAKPSRVDGRRQSMASTEPKSDRAREALDRKSVV